MSINKLPEGLLDAAKKILGESPDKVDPKKASPELDGVPADTHKDSEGTHTPAEASHLDPMAVADKLKEEMVSGEPSMLKPEEKNLEAIKVSPESCNLDPDAAENKMHEDSVPGMEKWIAENREKFVAQYGDAGETILLATAYMMKKVNESKVGHEESVPAEPSHLSQDDAEGKLKEDDEDDASHGEQASGKVPNLDSIARESVEVEEIMAAASAKIFGITVKPPEKIAEDITVKPPEKIAEEMGQNLDPQTAEVSNRDKAPKTAALVHEQSIGARGLRLELAFATGRVMILPPASEPALPDLASVFEYVERHFSDRPDWISAIEKALLD